jgi:dipeptidyl aminopeptidase/acylaminoacyl peptidase
MVRKQFILALVMGVTCGATWAQTRPTLSSPNKPPEAVSAPAASPNHTPATSEPDKPSGTDAARDAELAKQVTPLVDAFLNNAGVFAPDGKRLVFRSNRDGIDQLYVADATKADAPATRLFTSSERVTGARITRDGETVVFRSDKGADENWSIYRVDLGGKNLTELTPSETLNRDDVFLPERAPTMMYFSARKKEQGASSVYALLVTGGEAKKIYGIDGFGVLLDVAPDGGRLLFKRMPSLDDNTLEVVESATGKATKLYPTKGPVRIEDAKFSADGSRILVSTDTGGDRAVLLALDATNRKELARYTDPASATASVSNFVMPVARDKLACLIEAGNHNEVRLLDAATLKASAEVKLPLGSGSVEDFSDDGKSVVVTWSTPNTPTDLFAVNFTSGKVAPLRKERRPTIEGLPPLDVKVSEVAAHDGLKIPVHEFLPPVAKTGKKLPIIMNYHGGPANVSQIRWNAGARFFTSLGYVWVEPNVRGSSGYGRAYVMADDGVKRREALKDIATTGKWVAAQPWADKDRMVIYGGSYGGYTTLIGMTRYPSLWRAGVDLVGVVNWVSFMKATSGYIHDLFKTELGDPEKEQVLLEELSPIKDVEKIKAPLFVYTGANDPRVPRSEDDQIVKALRERGVLVEYMIAPNEGHSLSRRENQIEFYARAARFLEKALAR